MDPLRPKSSFLGQLSTMIHRNLLLKRKSIKMTLVFRFCEPSSMPFNSSRFLRDRQLLSLFHKVLLTCGVYMALSKALVLKGRGSGRTIVLVHPELLIPMIFLVKFALLGALMQKVNVTYPAVPEFADQPVAYPGKYMQGVGNAFAVGYAPSNDQTSEVMELVKVWWYEFGDSTTLFMMPFNSAEELHQMYMNGSWPGVGVIFDDPHLDSLDYTLRFPPQYMPPTSKPYVRKESSCRSYKNESSGVLAPDFKCLANVYSISGFVALQNLISTAYTSRKANLSDHLLPLNLSTKMMPEAPKTHLQGGQAIAILPATYLANLMTFYVIFLVIIVVTEKEKGYIESMKVMGLRPSVYWLSWIILYAGIMFFVSVLALTLAKLLNIWPHSNFLLLLTDCMMFGLSTIALGFCIAPFFRRPLIAGLVTYAFMQVFGFLYLVETFVPLLSNRARWGVALLAPAAYFMTLSRVAQAEAEKYGIGFGNAFNGSKFSFGNAISMLTFDLLLYSLLAIYLEKVFPSDETPKESPWFCLKPSYWFGRHHTVPSYNPDMEHLLESGNVEPVPDSVRTNTAIVIDSLRKVFPGEAPTVAVANFTYEVYEDEILAILGHNGAGKTTLINMITGMIAPTSGNVVVYGNDVTKSEELREARTLIGICPQNNVLFDTLTVKEHIIFYAKLKGCSEKAATEEYERIVEEIGMRSQGRVQAQNLSGGQKRRLSIAIAVVGNPKILILDEPTSGVDPFSQRFLWDMIRGFRKGRCVIITTQSMQEADVFADRKLIMTRGRLRCAGTSLFLKTHFGTGYHLTLAVAKENNEKSISDVLKSLVPGTEKTRSHAGELSYSLPKDRLNQFHEMFDYLDANLDALGIRSYGVALSSMEEVFLKLAEQDDQTEATRSIPVDEKLAWRDSANPVFENPEKPVSNWTKFWALAKIRYLLMIRSKLSLIFQVMVPVLHLVMNGVLTMLAKNWIHGLTAQELLDFDDTNSDGEHANLFLENRTTVNLDSLMEKISNGHAALDSVNYNNLLSLDSHFAGYIVHNATSAGQVLAASLVYNSSAIHSIPFSANALLNAVFRIVTGLPEIFRAKTHPFPSLITTSTFPVSDFMFASQFVSLPLVLIPGVYGIDVCRDRQVKTRSQIRMAGTSFWLYWGSAFFAHLSQFLGSFLLIVAFLYAFSVDAVTEAVGPIAAVFSVHAPAMILFCYCASFMFTKFETAAVGLPFPMAIIAFILYLVVFMLDALTTDTSGKYLHVAFSILFPFYGMFGAMVSIQRTSGSLLPGGGEIATSSHFEWNSDISVIIASHIIHIPLLLLLLIYLESRHFNQTWLQLLKIKSKAVRDTRFPEAGPLVTADDDVSHESAVAKDTDPTTNLTYALLLRNLSKTFTMDSLLHRCKVLVGMTVKTKYKDAVKDLSLVVQRGEIFGLLGPNGAGKTTSLSMVTGEITPTSGDVHVTGCNMHRETLKALESMGSCPQIDTLWEDVTTSEHLELFGILNGLRPETRKRTVKTFTEGLHITEHLSKKAIALSGGTKRKLTFIISMMGDPPLVMLDEPSTGMDPQSKRNLWDMMTESINGQRSAILTTHSMEEADALCDRIGIIFQGELRCIGSSQHLKDKFGYGYLLETKLSLPADVLETDRQLMVQTVKEEVRKILPGAAVVEEFYNRLMFAVSKDTITSLGRIFTDLDRMKQELNWETFTFSQTTIEQVFLHFAKLCDARAH